MVKVKFWGVRGSIAAPTGPREMFKKMETLLEEFATSGERDPKAFLAKQPFHKRSTYGGNTSCVEVTANDQRFVLDMGTGVRLLGNSLFPEMFQKKGLAITFLLSHVHWDHIQGLPFFGPLYINKATGILNKWAFYGGTNWIKDAETCLQGQMDEPVFPVSWQEIKKLTHALEGYDVFDQMSFLQNGVRLAAHKLNHPQETYGWRIEHNGTSVVYATDNEPYDPSNPDPRLLTLAKDADLLIIDCQYTKDVYDGKVGGVSRRGWGHSYPEAVAQVAIQAKVKQMALFHHDPASSDEQIAAIEKHTQNLIDQQGGKTEVVAANEGLEITLDKDNVQSVTVVETGENKK